MSYGSMPFASSRAAGRATCRTSGKGDKEQRLA
jgi:hypothetical protein